MSASKQSPRSIKREYWLKHIENWQAGNLSQKKYCEQENISYVSFLWWRRKCHRDKPNPKKISFIPAVIKGSEPTISPLDSNIQLILPNQTKLVLPSNLPINYLVSIVKSIGGLS